VITTGTAGTKAGAAPKVPVEDVNSIPRRTPKIDQYLEFRSTYIIMPMMMMMIVIVVVTICIVIVFYLTVIVII
jgi:hypothetical protein